MKRLLVLVPFIISMITHLALMLLVMLLLGGGDGNGKGDGDKDKQGNSGGKHDGVKNADVTPKTTKIDIELMDIPKLKGVMKKKPQKKVVIADKECPDSWYGGIGVGTFGDTVTRVYEGYAADLAGIKIDDVIVSSDGESILGAPGTVVRLTIMRNGVKMFMSIVRGKVCYKAAR